MENNNSSQPENRDPYNGQGGADSGSKQSAMQPQNPYTNPYYNGFDGGLYGGYQNNGNQNNAPYNAGQYGTGGYYDPNNQYGAQSGAPGGAYQQPDGSGQKYVFIKSIPQARQQHRAAALPVLSGRSYSRLFCRSDIRGNIDHYRT